MEPRKKLKRNQEKREERCDEDLDRLSCLPDSILTHILSFLDTKSVIRTSVLSKRYKLLWTMSPCLDFKLTELLSDSFDSYDASVFSQGKSSHVVSFMAYVNRIMQFREHSNLVAFRLSLHKDVCLDFAQKCIDYAAHHKVQHLRLRGFFKRKPFALPEMLLNSSSLITLHLHNATCNCIELPISAALPSLKVLCLKNFEFCDRNFSGGLFVGCPNLETLVLIKCCIRPVDKLKALDVNCSNLKNLEIEYWRSPWRCFDEHMINVNAPKLAFFKFQGHLVRVNFKDVLPCLERACIDLCYPTACFMVNANERKQMISESFLSMLHHLCNAKLLSLSLKTVEVLCAVPDLHVRAPIVFENLRVLKFTAENKYREKTIRIETVTELLDSIASGVLIFDASKETKVLPQSPKPKTKKESRHISIPAHVLHFLLEGSPAVEFLSIEIPNLFLSFSYHQTKNEENKVS
ncbi:hypothetical protein ACS0TY_028026 [Phlomoides rotata]